MYKLQPCNTASCWAERRATHSPISRDSSHWSTTDSFQQTRTAIHFQVFKIRLVLSAIAAARWDYPWGPQRKQTLWGEEWISLLQNQQGYCACWCGISEQKTMLWMFLTKGFLWDPNSINTFSVLSFIMLCTLAWRLEKPICNFLAFQWSPST